MQLRHDPKTFEVEVSVAGVQFRSETMLRFFRDKNIKHWKIQVKDRAEAIFPPMGIDDGFHSAVPSGRSGLIQVHDEFRHSLKGKRCANEPSKNCE